MTKLQAIRGMHDILMDETPNWQFVEKTIQYIQNQYGYLSLIHI